MRLLPRSLHARLLVISAAATIVALVIAGLVIAGVLERFVIEGLDRRLDSQVAFLAGTVGNDGQVDRTRLRTQLGALEADPGWRWRVTTPEGVVGSEDFQRLRLGPGPAGLGGAGPPEPPPGTAGTIQALDGPVGDIAVHARQLRLETSRGIVTVTAAAPRDVIRRPIRDAMVPLLVTLAALAALLVGATLVQLRVGLSPLRQLRDQVAAIRAGTRERADEDQPTELRGLAQELNALAADNAAALAAARMQAANLAHALKTPVAALSLELRAEPERLRQIARIDATIRHHLSRARAEIVDRRASTRLAPAMADLAEAVRRLHGHRTLRIDVAVAADLIVAVDAHDLDEMLGNLLDNAARFAATMVYVNAVLDPGDGRRVRIDIGDDGPGIAAADRARVAEPGLRLDERGDGHGFGLSIVQGLASIHGGSLALDERTGGGLVASLILPSARMA